LRPAKGQIILWPPEAPEFWAVLPAVPRGPRGPPCNPRAGGV